MYNRGSRGVGPKKGLKDLLLPIIVVTIAILVTGIITTTAVISPPTDYLLAGGLGFCVLALVIFLAVEWSRYREQNKGYINE